MKKNLLKKLTAVTVSAALVLSMAACGGSEATQSDVSETSESQETTEEAQSTESTESTESTGRIGEDNETYQAVVEELRNNIDLYGFEDPITLKMGFSFASDFEWIGDESFENNTWRNLYEDLGYNTEVLYNIDTTQADTKLATSITSGNYPDLLSGSPTEIVKYAETGVIADITDVFEEYASDELKEYVNYNGIDNLGSCMVDGRLYGLPTAVEPLDGMMMFIRKDWLDNLGLEIPTTMEELKTVAQAFTDDDPDGNGVDDTYGLALCGADGFTYWSGVQAFFEGYGAAPGYWNDSFTFIEKDGEVMWGGALSTEMKTALTDLQEMYASGALAKSFGTMDYNQLLQDVGAGTCGIYFAPRWGAMVPYVDALKTDVNAEIVAAMIPDGMGEGSSKAYIQTTPGMIYAISSKCEHPEAVVKLMNISVRLLANYQNMEERNLFTGQTGVYSGWKASWMGIGEPGSQEDGITKEIKAMSTGEITDDMTESQIIDVEAMQTYFTARENGTLADLLAVDDATVETGISSSTVSTETGGGAIMLKQIEEDKFNYSAYNTVPTENMSSCYSTLNKMALETIIKIIYGDSVDSYDDFLKSWNELGGEVATQEAQEWYDSVH